VSIHVPSRRKNASVALPLFGSTQLESELGPVDVEEHRKCALAVRAQIGIPERAEPGDAPLPT
jgi:hypothetical protein